jgi:hypothetical protein
MASVADRRISGIFADTAFPEWEAGYQKYPAVRSL